MRLPKCMVCKHFIDDDNELPTCIAFPKGIPKEIMAEDDEKECNNGIKFEEE